MNPTKQPAPRKTRLDAIRHWLISGVMAYRIAELAAQVWTIRPSQIQKDIEMVKALWAAEAAGEDFLAHLWLAKLQREQLYDLAIRQATDCKKPELSARFLHLGNQILKDRDKLMTQIEVHRRRSMRDNSPDHNDPHTGERMVTMPESEFFERCRVVAKHMIYQQRCEEREKARCAREGVPYQTWEEQNAAALKGIRQRKRRPRTPRQGRRWPTQSMPKELNRKGASALKDTPSQTPDPHFDPAPEGQTPAGNKSASALKNMPFDPLETPESQPRQDFTSWPSVQEGIALGDQYGDDDDGIWFDGAPSD